MIKHEELKLLELFLQHNLKFWLIGGHAIELVVGHAYRPHEDLDVLVEITDGPRMIDLLENHGFQHLQGSLKSGDVFYQKEGLIIDVVPIDATCSPPATLGELKPIRWPEEFLDVHRVTVQDLTFPTLSARMHLSMKSLIADFYQIPMREKDVLDLEHLHAFLSKAERAVDF